jgi:hypothetical protein
LERLRVLASEVAVLETEAIVLPGHEQAALLQFLGADSLSHDFTNYFAVSEMALRDLCLEAASTAS